MPCCFCSSNSDCIVRCDDCCSRYEGISVCHSTSSSSGEGYVDGGGSYQCRSDSETGECCSDTERWRLSGRCIICCTNSFSTVSQLSCDRRSDDVVGSICSIGNNEIAWWDFGSSFLVNIICILFSSDYYWWFWCERVWNDPPIAIVSSSCHYIFSIPWLLYFFLLTIMYFIFCTNYFSIISIYLSSLPVNDVKILLHGLSFFFWLGWSVAVPSICFWSSIIFVKVFLSDKPWEFLKDSSICSDTVSDFLLPSCIRNLWIVYTLIYDVIYFCFAYQVVGKIFLMMFESETLLFFFVLSWSSKFLL